MKQGQTGLPQASKVLNMQFVFYSKDYVKCIWGLAGNVFGSGRCNLHSFPLTPKELMLHR